MELSQEEEEETPNMYSSSSKIIRKGRRDASSCLDAVHPFIGTTTGTIFSGSCKMYLRNFHDSLSPSPSLLSPLVTPE